MSPAHLVGGRPRDPRQLAPVGAYMTDGRVLVEIVESDYSGVLASNVLTGCLVELERIELTQHWRRVRPATTQPEGT